MAADLTSRLKGHKRSVCFLAVPEAGDLVFSGGEVLLLRLAIQGFTGAYPKPFQPLYLRRLHIDEALRASGSLGSKKQNSALCSQF